MVEPHTAVVVAARRTPIAAKGGALAHLTAAELAAPVIRACVDDAPGDVADVVLGNCMGPGGNIARVAALAADLDTAVPGMTIDRQCGSGLAAIITAAQAIQAGDHRPRIAGGVESCSTAPTRIADGRPYARAPFAPPGHPDPDMVRAAQDLAVHDTIDRARQDAYAARSHRRAVHTRDSGGFRAELVPLGDVAADTGPRARVPGMLDRFPPLFPAHGGTLTAGNSCRDSDGAAAVMLAPGGPGLALVAAATVGCDPALPGLGPVPAVERLLREAGTTLDDVAAIEIVEAFAAQALAALTRLGLADGTDVDARVCADGGALALGHPWGASAAVSVVRLFSRLVRGGAPAGTLGLATAAVGGGLGVAALFQVVR
ncbi:thiolase family protein [Asanoa sp. WMMD1127]|uniref:thiolase family protein n=1 Tax=Asanoa sp. WMMD1127 TaxID=3016107 RepID=UPI0024176CB6|nr:thiolase family protein [Asanoa sp. WMMD1127]MDG4821114.1 thiolase family protein [Asanoa sp. WMMD1127]